MNKYCPHCGAEIKSKKILINFILDKSGSMESIRKATISGFNEYINSLKKDGNEYEISLTLFDTETKNYPIKNLKEQQDLNEETYNPNGSTALYDAVCKTVKENKDYNGKVLTVVMTDGEENASREYTEVNFRDIVKELTAKGNHTFVYLGANQDSWGNASKWGFSHGNVFNWNATTRGIGQVFYCSANATSSLAVSTSNSTADFMTEKDRKDIEQTK